MKGVDSVPIVAPHCTLDEVLSFLRQSHGEWVSEPSQRAFAISARQFLAFAVEDSKTDSVHSRVNVLSNIKRAIECRIDELLYALCLHVKSERENWNFPKKIQVLVDLGILAPTILTKINRKRNQLEHQYVEPTQEDVEDALDVTRLFFGYTDRFCKKGPIVEIRSRMGSKDLLAINRKNGIVELKESEHLRRLGIGDEDDWLELAKILASLWTRAL